VADALLNFCPGSACALRHLGAGVRRLSRRRPRGKRPGSRSFRSALPVRSSLPNTRTDPRAPGPSERFSGVPLKSRHQIERIQVKLRNAVGARRNHE
jgi:hypothetical protein